MGKLASLWRIATSWYVSLLVFGGVGIAVGYVAFFQVFPGRPKIGIIDIPFTVINEDSAFVISAFLDFARRDESIKAVVIKLSSPGGTAASSEQLYLETRKLREKKPVVIAITEVAASGGYMMSLGGNYTYAKAASDVGSVGVIVTFPGPLIPETPPEHVVPTGPFKLSGGTRRYWLSLIDALKDAFVQMVVSERGDRLKAKPEEIAQAKVYVGLEALRLGLVDGVGGDTDAIEKAARLAGISHYGLVDVNVEVARLFNEKFIRIIEPLLAGGDGQVQTPDLQTLTALLRGAEDSANAPEGATRLNLIRRLFVSSGVGQTQEAVLPEFPLKVSRPNLYYLYVGHSQ